MIPILPAALIDILDAPVPFLIGITRRQLDELSEERFEGRLIVNIDCVRKLHVEECARPVVVPDFGGLKKKLNPMFKRFSISRETAF